MEHSNWELMKRKAIVKISEAIYELSDKGKLTAQTLMMLLLHLKVNER
jgi:hypothetical protein